MPGITLLGLGPGDPGKLTKEAWDILLSAKEIWLRTNQHPTVKYIPDSVEVNSFDSLYDASDSFDVYKKIVSRVLNLGKRQMGVIYAVPGDPFVAEATCPEIARRARAKGLPVVTLSGVSFLEPVF